MRWICFLLTLSLHAETGYRAWLRYAPLASPPALPRRGQRDGRFAGAPNRTAGVDRGRSRHDRPDSARAESGAPREPAIVLQAAAAGLAPDAWSHPAGARQHPDFRRERPRRPLRRLRIAAEDRARRADYGDDRVAASRRALGERVEQSRRHDRARLRRPVDFLGQRPRPRRPQPRRANTAGCSRRIGINGCSINNVNANPRVLTPEFVPQIARIADALRPWGVRVAIAVDFGSPKSIGGLDTFDPLDPRVDRLVEGARRRALRADARSRRRRAEGGFRRPRRPVDLRPHARRCRQCGGARPRAARRAALLSRLRLRPSHGLEQSEERPRPRRLRQLRPARRQVRRQRDRADQERPHRFPGARAGVAAVRRAGENQPGDRTANHAGVFRPGAAHRLPRRRMWKDALDFDCMRRGTGERSCKFAV